MSERPKMYCKFLDGTGGVQCQWEGPYKYSRNTPSLAIKAFEDKETSRGIVRSPPFFQCQPALIVKPRASIPEADKGTYEWLVERQSECSKYK